MYMQEESGRHKKWSEHRVIQDNTTKALFKEKNI